MSDTSSLRGSTLEVPSQFGPYRIMGHLGHGGMGDVFKAKHLELDRLIALKVLPSLLSTPESLERFNSEALAVSRLQHQNIVTIYDYGEVDSRKYIAMQYIKGETLTKVIDKNRKLDYEWVVNIGKQICRALKYAHEHNVIHRDVKTGNILMDKNDRAFLTDFGIAHIPGAARLTTTGMAMGTPEYMAPEQCQGHPLDSQCDIYSLGIVLYEMIAGKPPFMGENPLSIAYKQVHDAPPLLSKVRPNIPRTLEMIVAKCLKKSKKERYRTAGELLDDLDKVDLTATQKTSARGLLDATEKLPDNRITERRGTDRRIMISKKPAIAIILSVAAASLLAAGGASWFILSRNPWPQAVHFLSPKGITINSSKSAPDAGSGAYGPVSLTFPGPASFGINLGTIHLVQGVSMAFDSLQANPESSSANRNILYITFLAGGQLLGKYPIQKTASPQFYSLKPVITSRITCRISFLEPRSGSPGSNRILIRDVRILGLPYPEN